MAQYLPTYVRAPSVTPLPYGLTSVVQLIDDPDIHWRNGIQYQPDVCETALVTLAQCPVVTGFTKTVTSDGLPARGAEPFTVYADISCSAPGGFWEESEARTIAALTNGEGRAVERVFWTGNADTPSGGVVRPHLAEDTESFDETGQVLLQPAATVGVTGTVDIVEGIGLLEAALASCYPGVGVIHAPRATLTHMAANHIVERMGPRMQTLSGTPVAFGAGYPGTAPDGSTPPAGTVWLYATGAITMRRSEVMLTSTRAAALDRSVNTLRLIAERTYVIGWDCCLLALPVSLGGIITGTALSAT